MAKEQVYNVKTWGLFEEERKYLKEALKIYFQDEKTLDDLLFSSEFNTKVLSLSSLIFSSKEQTLEIATKDLKYFRTAITNKLIGTISSEELRIVTDNIDKFSTKVNQKIKELKNFLTPIREKMAENDNNPMHYFIEMVKNEAEKMKNNVGNHYGNEDKDSWNQNKEINLYIINSIREHIKFTWKLEVEKEGPQTQKILFERYRIRSGLLLKLSEFVEELHKIDSSQISINSQTMNSEEGKRLEEKINANVLNIEILMGAETLIDNLMPRKTYVDMLNIKEAANQQAIRQ